VEQSGQRRVKDRFEDGNAVDENEVVARWAATSTEDGRCGRWEVGEGVTAADGRVDAWIELFWGLGVSGLDLISLASSRRRARTCVSLTASSWSGC